MYETLEHWKEYQKQKKIEKLELELKETINELDKFMWKLYHKNGTTKY